MGEPHPGFDKYICNLIGKPGVPHTEWKPHYDARGNHVGYIAKFADDGVPDYTTVVGVDARHLRQLSHTWPTWRRHKPSLLSHPMIVFYDPLQVTYADVTAVVDHPKLQVVQWPPVDVHYEGTPGDKWSDPQRYKMLAGFVYVPPLLVRTSYWLKLDTDVVATGIDDWINPLWFVNKPAIVSHKWSFTKPGDQMLKLDEWAKRNNVEWQFKTPALDLRPREGSDRVGHKRIISFVGFFHTDFSRWCANWAGVTCGEGKLPCQSQDGFHFYMAKRRPLYIDRVNMKGAGWQQWSGDFNIIKYAKEAMNGQPIPTT